MTVTANTTRNDYLAGNNQNVYNYTFQLNDAADVTVLLGGVVQTLNVHYTVQDLGVGTGGTITFTLVDSNNDPIFPTQGEQINILMTMELDRDTSYQPNGAFLSSDVNNDYDRLWLAANQQQTAINRSLRLQDQDATSGSMELPLKASRLNRMLAFDSVTGEPVAGPDVTSVTEGLTLSATLINGNNTNGNDVIFNDNDKAKFGTGSDLEIYHDGNNSVIKDSGTGILKYTSNNSTLAGVVFEIENTDNTNLSGSFIHFKDSFGVTPAKIGSYANAFYILNSSDERMLTTTNSGAIELYHSDDIKLSTTTSGIDVTGSIAVSGNVDGRDIATDGSKLDGIEALADVTDALNVEAAGALMGTGGTLTGDLNFGDNVKAKFGGGGDLEIYHNGNNSIIKDSGDGILRYTSSNSTNQGVVLEVENTDSTNLSGSFIHFKDSLGITPAKIGALANEMYLMRGSNNDRILVTNNSSVELYDADDKKFETSTSGVSISGDIDVTGTVDGRDVATDGLKLDGIQASADVTNATNVAAAGALMDSELTSIASVKALDQGVATTDSPTFAALTSTGEIIANGGIALGDNDKATFGDSDDLQIYHDSTNSIIKDSGTGILRYTSSNSTQAGVVFEIENTDSTNLSGSFIHFKDSLGITPAKVGAYANELYIMRGSNDNRIITTNTDAVELYYADDEKLTTTSSGIGVTGTVKFDGLEGTNSVNVTKILDEDNMASDSATALSTQQSIKSYVDTAIAGVPQGDITAVTAGTNLSGGGTTGAVNLDLDNNISLQNITLTGYLRGPANFTIDPAAHGNDTGTLVIAGNLQVDGTTTTINSTTVEIADLNFKVAKDATSNAQANTGGFTVGGSNAELKYLSSGDKWTMNKTLSFADSLKTTYGDNDDLQIYHDGSNSIIKDSGTGILRYTSSNSSTAGVVFEIENTDSTNLSGSFIHFKDSLGITPAKIGAFANELYIMRGSNNHRILTTSNGAAELYHSDDEKLATTSTGIDVTGQIQADSAYITGALTFPDNQRIKMGASEDLQIYHDGSNSYIDDAGTGNLYLRASNAIIMQSADGAETIASFHDDNLCRLYFDNYVKLATTSTGIDVTGTMSADGLTVDSADGALNLNITSGSVATATSIKRSGTNKWQWNLGSSNELSLYDNANSTYRLSANSTGIDVTGTATMDGLTVDTSSVGGFKVTNEATSGVHLTTYQGTTNSNVRTAYVDSQEFVVSTGAPTGTTVTERFRIASNGDISFYEDTGTTAKLFWDASAESLGIGTSSPTSYNSKADDLVVATSGDTGLSIISGTSNEGAIAFGDGTGGGSPIMGRVRYDHSTNSMDFRVNNDQAMLIDSSGNVGIGVDVPDSLLHIKKTTADAKVTLETSESYDCYINFSGATSEASIGYNATDNALLFCNPAGDLTAGEAMRIDSSGNLLVGTSDTAPGVADTNVGVALNSGRVFASAEADYALNLNRNTSNGDIVRFRKDGSSVGSIGIEGGDSLYIQGGTTSGSGLHFHPTGATVRPARNGLTIDNVIDLGTGTRRFKDLYLSGSLKSTAPTTSASTPAWLSTASTNTAGQTHYHAVFKSLNGTTNGKITTNYYATTYSTTSDYRVKEDIQPIINATERLLNLNAINFQWKGSDIRTDGFLAHEVAEIIPEAVVGEKDEDELQSLDQSKIVPLLVKTIQELEARITQLENQ